MIKLLAISDCYMNSSPPQPTDLSHVEEYPVDRCRYCLDIVESLSDHYNDTECNTEDLVEVTVNDTFGIVVPEQSGYLWTTKTDAFANRHVNIQGTYIHIGDVWSSNQGSTESEFPVDLSKLNLEQFDNPQELRRIIETGVRKSDEYQYGGEYLGKKLVNERLDGVYEDEEEVRERKLQTRDERIQDVWGEIDDALPFTYNRVAAPEGYPRTREGVRWIEITGHNPPESVEDEAHEILFREPWVDSLVDRGPVALYYPNSD